MATKVKMKKGTDFTFKTAKGGGSGSKYDWDGWFNGDLLLIERSEGPENDKGTIEVPTIKRDYEVPTDAMAPKLKTAGRRRYKVVQISRLDADGNKLVDALIIRARDMDDTERQAEDILRAEEKDEMKAKRKAKADAAKATAPTADGTAPDATPPADATPAS